MRSCFADEGLVPEIKKVVNAAKIVSDKHRERGEKYLFKSANQTWDVRGTEACIESLLSHVIKGCYTDRVVLFIHKCCVLMACLVQIQDVEENYIPMLITPNSKLEERIKKGASGKNETLHRLINALVNKVSTS
jgi:hypothetical protein